MEKPVMKAIVEETPTPAVKFVAKSPLDLI